MNGFSENKDYLTRTDTSHSLLGLDDFTVSASEKKKNLMLTSP